MTLSAVIESTNNLNQVFENSGAFAVIKDNGSVVAWGKFDYGGDSGPVNNMLDGTINVIKIFSAQQSFAALREDGSVVVWGRDFAGNPMNRLIPELDGRIDVVQIYSNNCAFVALRKNGSVVTWGEAREDETSHAVSVKIDGTVAVKEVCLSNRAFAALREDGSVVTWGDIGFGGDSSAIAMNIDGSIRVVKLYSNGKAFAALREDGSVVTWGDQLNGGYVKTALKSQLDGKIDVKEIYPNEAAGVFCALLDDGSVVTWGNVNFGTAREQLDPIRSKPQIDAGLPVFRIYSNESAFAAIRSDGSVTAWGGAENGADTRAVQDQLNGSVNVVDIVSGFRSFAALRRDGSVITWGDERTGGDSRSVKSQLDGSIKVINIVSNGVAFAALREDGSVVTWGRADSGGNSALVATELDGHIAVKNIYFNANAFAALRKDGSVITWGIASEGGDSNEVKSKLDGKIDVVNISSVDSNILDQRTFLFGSAFSALREDGSVITWGSSTVGGDSSVVAEKINDNVLSFSNSPVIEETKLDVIQPPSGVKDPGNINLFNNAPTGAVTIQSNTKVFTVGSILTTKNTIRDKDDLGDFTYEWRSEAGILSSNKTSSYQLTQNEMGKNVWVTVIYTDTLATVEKVKSKATLPISQSTKSSLADDVLTGKKNPDKLTGLAGNDTLIGGLGKDNLTGGIGADIFKFNAVNETASIKKKADVIVDFKTSENDKIDLSAIDANSTLIGNQSFKFIKGNQFDASVIGQVYFNSTDQTLYGTTREDMKPEFAIYLAGVKSMTADDFIL